MNPAPPQPPTSRAKRAPTRQELDEKLRTAILDDLPDSAARTRRLLALGANPSASILGARRDTMAIHACVLGHPNCLRALIAAGADIDAANAFGATPLIAACAEGHPLCARILIEAGCALAPLDELGRNACHHAARRACHGSMAALLQAGADASLPEANHEGCTPAMHAFVHADELLLRMLLSSGPDLSRRNSSGLDLGAMATRAKLSESPSRRACADMVLAEIQRRELDGHAAMAAAPSSAAPRL